MSYQVIFSPEAEEQLLSLYRYIAVAATPNTAKRYVEAIVAYCETLDQFPIRGIVRDDVRPGLRVTHYKKRAVIAFTVETDRVLIIGVYYGGQDYESVLREEDDA